MGKQQDREKTVQAIKTAADLYRKHLIGDWYISTHIFDGYADEEKIPRNCLMYSRNKSIYTMYVVGENS